MPGPLAGIRVIEVAIAVLGPVAAQVLGDMGAEVIKVETPDGDPMRQIGPARNPGMAAYFLNVNRNKKSLVLDLKRPAARAAMLRLAATADVFLQICGRARRSGSASTTRRSPPPTRASSMPGRAAFGLIRRAPSGPRSTT